MPYKLVLSKNGTSEEVTAVPEGWVVGTYLYWPRSLKKSEIESLRSDENSIADKSWKKFKCRIKLGDISSFKEALRLEDLYSKFQDTEDEDMYLNERQNKKKKQTANILSMQLLDVNSEFDMDENNITQDENISDEVKAKPGENITKNSEEINVQVLSSNNQNNTQVTIDDVEGTSSDDILTLKTSELLKIVQENNSLQTENRTLKEELLRSVEFQNETRKNFAIMQIQLDKIIDLLQNKNRDSNALIENDCPNSSEDGVDKLIIGNIKFPIDTKEQLDALEYKLLKKDVMTFLVKKFSETCGTSGIAKISKVGLPLMIRIIKDELLNQFSWKGIKGSTKIAFLQYVKIRELFYKIAHLADKSCSFRDSDLFIQNSAIKHSGQRVKRQALSSESKINEKRTKKEMNVIEKDSSQNITSDADMIENLITAEKTKESTDGLSLNNKINEVNFYITENNHDSETNEKSTDGNNRDTDEIEMGGEKSDSEMHCGSNNEKEMYRDLNDENKDTSNTETLQGSSKKKEAGDLSKITILSDIKICNKAVDIKNMKKIANISSTNVTALFDDLINFSP